MKSKMGRNLPSFDEGGTDLTILVYFSQKLDWTIAKGAPLTSTAKHRLSLEDLPRTPSSLYSNRVSILVKSF
jgi:hypothetical protein